MLCIADCHMWDTCTYCISSTLKAQIRYVHFKDGELIRPLQVECEYICGIRLWKWCVLDDWIETNACRWQPYLINNGIIRARARARTHARSETSDQGFMR